MENSSNVSSNNSPVVSESSNSSSNNSSNLKTFSIKESLSFGWKKLLEHFWFFVLLTLVFMVVSAILDRSGNAVNFADSLSGLLSTFISMFGTFTLVRFALMMHKGTKPQWKDIFEFEPKALGLYILASILFSVAYIVGFFLLIIPGLIVMIRLGFFPFIMLEENLSPIPAFKKSWAMTNGYSWQILGFIAVMGFINLLGAIALMIGLLITVPLTMLSSIYVYEKIKTSV